MLRLSLITTAIGVLAAGPAEGPNPEGTRPPLASPDQLSQAHGSEIRRTLTAMGTRLSLSVTAAERRVALLASEDLARAIDATEARLSTWRGDSEVAQLNAEQRGSLSRTTAAELESVLAIARTCEGAFDPTCGALVEAWGLRSASGPRRPSPAALDAALARTGWQQVALDGLDATLSGGVLFEEGAWGKGAGLDRALEALALTAATGATIDLGGQVAWFGRAPRTFDLSHPDRRHEVIARVDAAEQFTSVATTGNSERGTAADGKWIGHVIDPRTGEPADDFGSLTVLAGDALSADAFSTGLYVLGPAAALALAERIDGLEVVIAERDGSEIAIRHSSGLDGRVRGVDPTAPLPHDPDPQLRSEILR
ncbi:MAG: FAD:protein FMN transferase [Planctomycetota bacterium]